ncbi:uncharacterized protein morgue [Chelonus insularis]|uniref:uncharacterized protein morgue n=1 Tax=Chelonus insularis TaxID=460826 RepID=UPI00158C9902|nr:uncharacterized protein LOC118064697 [Chelonus insularis]
MAGDNTEDTLNDVDNSEKSRDKLDFCVYSNSGNEYLDTIEFISCPEFQFSTLACYICNGYYGPCFEEPVCATCHAFLFPDDTPNDLPIFSEKTDDEDSGNDEPIDLFYNAERKTSQLQRPHTSSQNTTDDDSVKVYNQIPQNSKQSKDFLRHVDHKKESQSYNNGQGLPRIQNLPSKDNGDRSSYNRWNSPNSINNGESSTSGSLAKRVELLTNHKYTEHETINESGLVERLPPEVLLAVFSHLDDVSLWSAANVCRRWHGLLLAHIPPQQWQQHVKHRWPLYKAIGYVDNWYKVYDCLASSMPCRRCLAQMCLRSKPATVEENSWRRNRLRTELKSLRTDPPEGIEATPLDIMCCHWQATITGPIGSPYEGGLFYLYLQVPYSYPMCPPIVRFLTKILHPNVSRHGDVGIDSIHHNWSLALTISKVLISVQSLLTDPYCHICMEPELGRMYTNNRERFEEVARAWTWKYAMHDVVTWSQ